MQSAVGSSLSSGQRSGIETNLRHADWFAAQGMTIQAIGFYRTAATLAERAGDYGIALRAFDAVARLEGIGSEAKLRIGAIHVRIGNRTAGAALLEHLANESLQTGRPDQALEAFALAADAEPTRARWAAVLHWHDHFGRQAEGTRALEHAAVRVFTAQTDDDAVVVIGRLLLERKPGHEPSLRQLIRVHLRRRELHRAVESIQALLRVRRGDADALEQMAHAFKLLGRPDKAAEVLVKLAGSLADTGAAGVETAKRLVSTGLAWEPGNSELLLLRRRFNPPKAKPRPKRRSSRPPAPPVDLSEFIEAVPEEFVEAVPDLPPLPTSTPVQVAGDWDDEELTEMLDIDMLEVSGDFSVVATKCVRAPRSPGARH